MASTRSSSLLTASSAATTGTRRRPHPSTTTTAAAISTTDGLEYSKRAREIARSKSRPGSPRNAGAGGGGAHQTSPVPSADHTHLAVPELVIGKTPSDQQQQPQPQPLPPADSPTGNSQDGAMPLVDVDCDPANPKLITFSDISSAAFKLKHGVEHTPCQRSSQLSRLLGLELYVKKEYTQITGSFKERGARYALLRMSPEDKARGVVAASAGNHALALCYHGQQLGIPVTVVMPVFAPLMKISMCRSYGATIILKGNDMTTAKEFAMRLAADEQRRYVNGYDHPDVIAGQGTIGLEILEQVPEVDAVLVPVGGAGLIAGVAVAIKTLKPDVKIIAVEADACASFTASYNAGKLVSAAVRSGLADGLAVGTIGCNALLTSKGLIDRIVTVDEKSIALAILRIIEMEKAVVEGASAVWLAALLSDQLPELKGKRVVGILTGGNIDTTVLGRTIERGLAVDGRLGRVDVVVTDRPGGIAELATHFAHCGASIKDILHERAWVRTDVFSVKVKQPTLMQVVVETRDTEHLKQLEDYLRTKYSDVTFY